VSRINPPKLLKGHSTTHPPNQVNIANTIKWKVTTKELKKSLNLKNLLVIKGKNIKITILITRPITPPNLLGTLRKIQ